MQQPRLPRLNKTKGMAPFPDKRALMHMSLCLVVSTPSLSSLISALIGGISISSSLSPPSPLPLTLTSDTSSHSTFVLEYLWGIRYLFDDKTGELAFISYLFLFWVFISTYYFDLKRAIVAPPGSGPRHFAFHPFLPYLLLVISFDILILFRFILNL